MLIMGSKSGQLANRLFAFGHFIANAIEHGYALINPTLDEYCEFFPATRSNDFGTYRIGVRLPGGLSFRRFQWIHRKLRKYPIWPPVTITHHEEDRSFDLNDGEFLNLVKRKVVIPDGWLFRDHVHFKKHAGTIRGFFKPMAEFEENAKRAASTCRADRDVVVGVHVRKSGYRDWQGGQFYFSDEVYLDKMLQVQGLLEKTGRRAAFLLCSDEQIDREAFSAVSSTTGTGHLIEDLYALSNCDFIIGPPSTFSMWASFYGEVPLQQIRTVDHQLSLDSFKVNCG